MSWKKVLKRFAGALLVVFVLMNVVAAFHAYRFTHFSGTSSEKTEDENHISGWKKLKALCFGVTIPRPENKFLPSQPYKTLKLQSNKSIECWSIKCDSSKGTVIVCHGYCGTKSAMLDKSDEFLKMGYSTFLPDFMGSGGSEGEQTTIGCKEAEEVKSCYDYLAAKGEKKIILFGTSMGAAAVLKCVNDYDLHPFAIIVECPFGSMYQTTCARFHSMGVPSFPMAGLLDFWGGVENNFWAFSLRPVDYAKKVKCPALLLYGEMDNKVSRAETDEIFANLAGPKKLKTYPLAGHENYLAKYKAEWTQDVQLFLENPGLTRQH